MWDGAFVKHRLYTGDIKNHLGVAGTAAVVGEPDPTMVDLGGGERSWHVQITFGKDPTKYDFVINSDEQPTEDEIKEHVANFLNP